MTVELTDHCLPNMRKGKARGVWTGQALWWTLVICTPFTCYTFEAPVCVDSSAKCGFVPSSFACGISIPLIKDKTGNLNDVDNYHRITLPPIISKLFEMSALEICNDIFTTDFLYSLVLKLALAVQMQTSLVCKILDCGFRRKNIFLRLKPQSSILQTREV